MSVFHIDLPSLYGDHHVSEVRRILFELEGVEEVYASSSFQAVDVTYDPNLLDPQTIRVKLEEAGYTQEPVAVAETGLSTDPEKPITRSLRHTAAYEHTGTTISFAQNANYTGRPLWPCPGLGVIRVKLDEEDATDG